MAFKIHKIVSFATTETNKSFCLETIPVSIDINSNEKVYSNTPAREMYYAEIEDRNIYVKADGRYYNAGCLKDDYSETCFTTLYNSKDLYLKSAIYGSNEYYDFPNTHAFQNIFNFKLSTDLTNLILVDNYIYLMNTDLCNIGKYCFTQDMYSELSMNNGYVLMPHNLISTNVFDVVSVIKAIQNPNITEVSVVSTYTNIGYNYFLEIPGNIKNDYNSGNYAANVYTTKNQYNSLYDMTHEGDNILTNARRYIAIDHCNNQVYLKYYDDQLYLANDGPTSDNQLYNLKFQRLEVVKALNRFETINTHKTNYYDIDIVCEQLFNDFNDAISNTETSDYKLRKELTDVKQNLKHEIANCIVDICKNITPIDTQLVKVNVLENELGLD